MTVAHEIWLARDNGTRLTILDRVERFEWTRAINNIGRCTITLPGDFDRSLLKIDNQIQIQRAPSPTSILRLEDSYFIRRPIVTTNESGLTRIQVHGVSPIELLTRRIVAYAAGSAQANKTDFADDMMKAIVRENLGALAGVDGFGDSRSFDATYFGVAPDFGLGPSLTKAFSRRNVLLILQDLAEAARTAGNEVFFAVVPATATTFEFRTFTGQPGLDRRFPDGTNPIVFSLDRGNFELPFLEDDFEFESNYVYGGGQGEGVGREIQEVRDLVRINTSIWNRREAFRDARHESTAAGVLDEAESSLAKGRPKRRFTAIVLSSEGSRYGLDWDFGDRITVEYLGEQFDGLIRIVRVNVNNEGLETVEGRVEVEDVA